MEMENLLSLRVQNPSCIQYIHFMILNFMIYKICPRFYNLLSVARFTLHACKQIATYKNEHAHRARWVKMRVQ